MASSVSENKVDAFSKKIDEALSLWNGDHKVDDCLENTSDSEIISCEEMLKAFKAQNSTTPSNYCTCQRISPGFPFDRSLHKSKMLADEKLYETILHSKIFENKSEFEERRAEYKGQLVWVEIEAEVLMLISQNQIIYALRKPFLRYIRNEIRKTWDLLKVQVKNNLIKTFSVPESTTFDAPTASNTPVTFNQYQAGHSMTEEVQKIMLDELNSFNLDTRVKQQFAFDLKVLPVKDVCYWRDRLDSLRLCSSCAVASSPESPDLQKIAQQVAKLEKMTENTATCLAYIYDMSTSMVSETVSESEKVGEANIGTLADPILSLSKSLESQLACSRTADEEAKVRGGNQIGTVSILVETSKPHETGLTNFGDCVESNQDVDNLSVEIMQHGSTVVDADSVSRSCPNVNKQKTEYTPSDEKQLHPSNVEILSDLERGLHELDQFKQRCRESIPFWKECGKVNRDFLKPTSSNFRTKR